MRRFFRRTRFQLTLLCTTFFFALAGPGTAAFWALENKVEYGVIDAGLASQAGIVRADLARLDPGPPTPALPAETVRGIPIAAVVFTADGRVVTGTPSGRVMPGLAAAVPKLGLAGHPVLTTQRLGGIDARVLVEPVALPDGSAAGLVVARAIVELEERLTRLGEEMFGGLVAATLLALVLSWWLAGRVLAPVRQITARARDISERDLDARINLDLPPGDALGDLAATLDSMLARLDRAFVALRRFTGDAAHEFRAPLALMRTRIELALRRTRDREHRETLEALLREVERLSRLADRLLMLARADAGELGPHRRVFDFADLLEETADRWRPVARRHGVAFNVDLPGAGTIDADPELLVHVLDNLLDNAFRYAPAKAGEVELEAARVNGNWSVRVSDTGPGVDPDLRSRLFDRFTRGDSARGRATGGAGLGLSVCAAIVKAHGGTIELSENGHPGASFVVTLPAS